jgi:hypothetical protein
MGMQTTPMTQTRSGTCHPTHSLNYYVRSTRFNINGNNNSTNGSVNLAKGQMATGTSMSQGACTSLEDRISDTKLKIQPYCNHCQCTGHWSSKCCKFPENKCHNCRKIGHWARDCRKKKKDKDRDKGKKKDGNGKAGEQLNVIEEVIAFNIEEELHNFDTFDTTCNIGENDDHLIYYDWLADTTTDAHVMHQREAFINYTLVRDQNVTGIGGPAMIAS